MLLIKKAEDKELPEDKDLTAIRFRALRPAVRVRSRYANTVAAVSREL